MKEPIHHIEVGTESHFCRHAADLLLRIFKHAADFLDVRCPLLKRMLLGIAGHEATHGIDVVMAMEAQLADHGDIAFHVLLHVHQRADDVRLSAAPDDALPVFPGVMANEVGDVELGRAGVGPAVGVMDAQHDVALTAPADEPLHALFAAESVVYRKARGRHAIVAIASTAY